MAKIELYQPDVKKTIGTPGPSSPRFSGNETAGLNRAIQGFGKSLSDLGTQYYNLNVQQEENEYSTAEVIKFRTNFNKAIDIYESELNPNVSPRGYREKLFSAKHSFTLLDKNGEEQSYSLTFQEYVDKLKDKMSTNQGKYAVQLRADRYKERVSLRAHDFEVEATVGWNAENREKSMTGWANEVKNNPDDEGAIKEIYREAEQSVTNWNDKHKLSLKQTSAIKKEIANNLARSRVAGYLEKDPVKLDILLNKNKKMPDWAKSLTIPQLLHASTMAAARASKVGYEELQNTNDLMASELKNIENNGIDHTSLMSVQQIYNVKGEDGVKKQERAREHFQAIWAIGQELEEINVSTWSSYVLDAERKKNLKSQGFADNRIDDILKAVITKMLPKLKQFQENPVDYFIMHDSSVAAAYAAAKESTTSGPWNDYFKKVTHLQDSNGVLHPKLLPKGLAKTFTTKLLDAAQGTSYSEDPNKAAEQITNIIQTFKKTFYDSKFWPGIIKEIIQESTPLVGHGIEKALVFHDTIYARYAASSIGLTNVQLKERIPVGAALSSLAKVEDASRSALNNWTEAFAGAPPGSSSLMQMVSEMAIVIASSTSNKDLSAVVTNVVSAMVESAGTLSNDINTNKRHVFIPISTQDGTQVEPITVKRSLTSFLGKGIINLLGHQYQEDFTGDVSFYLPNHPIRTEEKAREEYITSLEESAYWRNDGPDNFQLVYDDINGLPVPVSIVKKINGVDTEIKFVTLSIDKANTQAQVIGVHKKYRHTN